MTYTLLITAILTGLLGSAHCVGMCGPIALALPVSDGSNKAFSLLLYNFGRALTYAVLGIIPGLIGVSLHMAGFSQWISIALGVVLLLMVLMGYGKRLEKLSAKIPFLHTIRKRIGLLFSKAGYQNLFAIGLLNGLLPCGLVYTALVISVGMENLWQSSLFMFLFGMGTLPAMFLMSWFGHMISVRHRQKLNKLVPYMIGIVAVLLIVRGLNLGIPYISPKISAEQGVECCTKPGKQKKAIQ
jgi:sulfite exporter TauE/SafE